MLQPSPMVMMYVWIMMDIMRSWTVVAEMSSLGSTYEKELGLPSASTKSHMTKVAA